MRGALGRRVWASIAAATCVVVSMLGAATAAWSHPLHTTFTEIGLDSADGTARLTIRAFADDLTGAAARHAGHDSPVDQRIPDALMAAYVAASVSVADAGGRRVPMTWLGMRRAGNLVWITVRAPSVHSLRGVKLRCALLFETFNDQVNIVLATEHEQRRTLLFTRGDASKMRSLF
jgi:hypothetical protein